MELPQKKVRVKKTDTFLREVFLIKTGDELNVLSEGRSDENKKYYYRVTTLNDKAIVLYEHEVEVING